MSGALKNIQANISTLQEVVTNAGTNDKKRGERYGIARATAQKIRDGNISQMMALVATQPDLAAALLVDALRNAGNAMSLETLEAVERHLTTAGQMLEDRHDVLAEPALEAAAQDYDDRRYEAAAQLTDSIIA